MNSAWPPHGDALVLDSSPRIPSRPVSMRNQLASGPSDNELEFRRGNAATFADAFHAR
jgi:hypothetical protein